MGTILASAIISKASALLQDAANTRWSQAELLGWLNTTQREIVIAMPELTATIGNLTLVAGTKQTLPSTATTLMGDMRNMGADGATPGVAVRETKRHLLDSQAPDWHSMTASAVTKHYIYDGRSTRNFYVYPPAVAGQKLEALYSTPPTDIATTSSTITIDDIFEPVLLEGLLGWAFGKDIEVAGNAEKAAVHRQNFATWLSAKKGMDAATKPPSGSAA